MQVAASVGTGHGVKRSRAPTNRYWRHTEGSTSRWPERAIGQGANAANAENRLSGEVDYGPVAPAVLATVSRFGVRRSSE
jgi:hypothetical protein